MTELDKSALSAATPFFPRIRSVARVAGVSAEQRWSRDYRIRLFLSDTLIVAASVGAAFLARFGISSRDLGGLDGLYWIIGLGVIAIWLMTLTIHGTRDIRVLGVGISEYRRVVGASVFTFGALAMLFLVFKVEIARGFFILTLPIGLLGLVASRYLWRRWITRQRVVGRYLSRAVVGGKAADVAYVIDQLERNAGATYHVVGVAIDTEHGKGATGAELRVPVVADLEHLALAAVNLRADTVILAGQPSDDRSYVRDLSWALEGTAADLVLASGLTDVAGPRIHFRPVEGLPLIHVEIPRFEGTKHALKRALDVVISGVALVVLAPVLIVLAVLVKIDSPGRVIFSQQRVGRNRRIFTMLKFRSMVQSSSDALHLLHPLNDGAGPLFKLKSDPRVTRLGRVLRRYSLDELPQLWNVFRGDMSLVGPRPPLPREVETYEDHVHRRLYIKPGLTGMWQISGRSNLTWEESIRLDLYYVENWSIISDLIILWRTVKVVVRPVGAY